MGGGNRAGDRQPLGDLTGAGGGNSDRHSPFRGAGRTSQQDTNHSQPTRHRSAKGREGQYERCVRHHHPQYMSVDPRASQPLMLGHPESR
jgi:hypothetical protein